MKLSILNTKSLFIGLISIGLLCNTPCTATAQPSANNNKFHPIQQPLGIKIGITATGLGLIGLELWWFLANKNKV